jgi:hypothetical protein
MKKLKMLAIDLGASSGRGIVGSFDGEKLTLEENHRFPNEPVIVAGTFSWDILRIFHEIKNSIRKCALSDDKDTRNNKGLMVNFDRETQEITSKFVMKELPAEIARQVENLSVGEISKAFVYTTEQGKEICAIVKLKSRVEAHRATLTEDYQVLKDVVLQERRAEKLETWIKEKQRSTYVRINPEWRNCNFKYPDWSK